MLKKILPLTFVFILVLGTFVQAVEKEQSKNKAVKTVTKEHSTISNEELENLYNNVMSSQLEEEPEDKDIPTGLEIGTKAPDFQLKTLNGKSIHLSDYKGKNVLINFFATWCHPCKEEMPIIENYYKTHKSSIEIVGINVDPKSDVKGFIKKTGVTFPVLLDEQDDVNALYHILAIPTSYLINEKGIIKNKQIGSLTKDGLEALMNNGK